MNWSSKTVIISGVGGFIGYNLTKRLLKKGCRIIGVDNFSYVKRQWSEDILKEIELLEGDCAKNNVFEKLKKEDIDYVFNFGSPSSIVLYNKNPKKCFTETVISQLNWFKFSLENNVKKIIYPSSGSVYAGVSLPHKENRILKPRNLYAAAKIACESIAASFSDFVNNVGLRIFAGYGPGEERKGFFGSVIYLFIRDILNNKSPLVYGDGSQIRDFIYIEDVIKAIILSTKKHISGVVNVGTGIPVSFNQVIEIIEELTGKKINPTYTRNFPKNYVKKIVADTSKMKKIFKIKPMHPKKGIEMFIDYLMER